MLPSALTTSALDQSYPSIRKDVVGESQRFSDNTGYLMIRTLRDPDDALILRLLIKDVLPLRALIVDLRGTSADDVDLALQAASLFVKSGRVLHYEEQTKRGLLRSSIDLTDDGFVWSGEKPGEAYANATWRRVPFACDGLEIIVLTGEDPRSRMGVEMLAHAMAANSKVAFWGDTTTGDGVPARFFRVLNGRLLRIVRTSRYQSATGKHVDVDVCAPGIKPRFELGDHIPRRDDLVDVARRSLEQYFAASPGIVPAT